MGTAASVPGQEGFHELPEDQHRSRRSGNQSARTSNSRSVRAMALMNHSRQENSYIHADSISSHLIARVSRRQEVDDIEFPKQFTEKGEGSIGVPRNDNSYHGRYHFHRRQSHEPTLATVPSISNIPIESKGDYEPGVSEKDPVEPNSSPSSPKAFPVKDKPSLSAFRSNMNLKLDLGGDAEPEAQEWPAVAHEHLSDDEGEHDLDLHKFDNHRIELPIPEGAELVIAPPPAAINIKTPGLNIPKIETETGVQFTHDGATMFVDGMNVGVGVEGIVRPDKGLKKHEKLPMRERLIILCKLGSGASSAVYKALDLVEMRLVALKTIQVYEKEKRVQMVRELTALFQLLRENSRRESSHLKRSQRPEKYIVDFYDAFINLEDGLVCMMIEYMDGGSLQDIVDHGGNDDESALANIAIQALKGLSFLHNNNQLHRDLKPGNFLISHRGEVKVADLGILKQLPPKAPGVLQRTKTFVGTATYMSPERIDGKEYGFPSDVWAFGLSLVTIALGKIPFETEGGYWTVLKNIRDGPSPSLPADKFSSEFRDFIGLCMKKNPEERASCKDLLMHPFMNKVAAEDLTYQQSYERGRSELIKILEAMVTHVEQLKKDALSRFGDADNFLNLTPRLDDPISDATKQAYAQNTSAAHEKLFGNLMESTTVETMKRILFDERGPSAGGTTRLTKPRLGSIARQLHMQVDRVTAEARIFLDNLARTGSGVSPTKNT